MLSLILRWRCVWILRLRISRLRAAETLRLSVTRLRLPIGLLLRRLTVRLLSGRLSVTLLLRRLSVRRLWRLSVCRLLRRRLSVRRLLRLSVRLLSGRLSVRLRRWLSVLPRRLRLRRLSVRRLLRRRLSVLWLCWRRGSEPLLLRRREALLLRRLESLLRIARSRLSGLWCRRRWWPCLCGLRRLDLRDRRRGVAEHRLGLHSSGRCAGLHRRHRSSARPARGSVHQNRRAAVRARSRWCRHLGFPLSFRSER